MNAGISEQGRAVPPWLHLGDEGALSAGVARGLNVALALLLAGAGGWLLTSTGDAGDPQASAGVVAKGPAPGEPGPEEAGPKGQVVPVTGAERVVGESAAGDGAAATAVELAPDAETGGAAIRAPGTPGKLDPKAAESLAQRGEQALKSGKRSSAKKLFEEAIALDPDNAAALMGLSNLSFDAGNYVAAERYAKQAVQLAPRNADYQLRLGDAYLKLGQNARARSHYQRAQKLGHPFAGARLERLPKG